MAATEQGLNPQEAKEALDVLISMWTKVQDPAAKLVATRCFRVKTGTQKDEEDTEGMEVKWIFAISHYPKFKMALTVLRENGALAVAGIHLCFDIATRSRAAKLLETLAFQGGSS
ncbi:unnamed protein product [Prorocentrum cordatum]|uniref:Uncharacterized protein n=1 Tax=Prorocentrum cordatum TaxID=2364126 RepID=A0ABN9R4Z3_9DINO|nr:unnamed protein product [Polarella glacialis]